MDTKNITMTVIGLAVAVILVAGFMTPVIASVINGNGGGDDGETTYVNEGTLYYKAPVEGETHTITLTDDFQYESEQEGSDYAGTVTVEYDGNTLITVEYERLELETELPEPIIIPILFGSATIEVQPGIEATQIYGYVVYIDYSPYADPYDPSNYGLDCNVHLTTYTGAIMNGEIVQSFADNGGFENYPYEITINGDSFTTEDLGGYELPGVQLHICDEGDLVYTDNPVFSADSDVMMAYSGDIYRFESAADWDVYGLYATYTGKIGEMNTDDMIYQNLNNTAADIVSMSEPIITTTEYRGALRLTDISMTVLFEDDAEKTYTTSSLIVPVEVEVSGSGGGSGGVDGPLASLIMAIPLLTVIGLVIGAVAVFRKG